MAADGRNDALVLEDGRVRYERDGAISWQLSIEELLLVGEWTEDALGDDYFYYFVAGRPPQVFFAPMYANSSFIPALAIAMGASFELGLVNRTDYASRVLWPPSLEGHGLFVFFVEARPKRPLSRVLDRLFPRTRWQLTQEVFDYLEFPRAASGNEANEATEPPG